MGVAGSHGWALDSEDTRAACLSTKLRAGTCPLRVNHCVSIEARRCPLSVVSPTDGVTADIAKFDGDISCGMANIERVSSWLGDQSNTYNPVDLRAIYACDFNDSPTLKIFPCR